MNKYSYSYKSDGIYFYNGINVLKNKLDIKDPVKLKEFEEEYTSLSILEAL